jgi:DNA-directed RNA polymerase subunit L
MNINVLEEKKNKIIFEVDGVSHGFCNLLKSELWEDKTVKVATYAIRHPLVGKPKFIVETDGAEPKKVLTSATQRVQKTLEKFEKEFAKEV